ncbi:aminodeoxychorismate synthase component I [Paraburkholderia sartisoli]|uniref:Para-aminobenzoate synthetase / 4-amino-4-deoxychorismate lyase n=1 Tax=Paraburkholderia sartisoli TaxID=83784 RepID=A0A1H4D8C7_9BURK|nr:aminodeoxychorismate synthase component I [Paraburkholderia sartisoli]SEA68649.1 para-aminobenzoate synthetase / 4-amino-4-deoxychorismate lyase [Paraburkholderia sartisoli]
MVTDERGTVFALLDDCDSTAARRTSRLYTGFVRERACADAGALDTVCDAVAADLRDGLHAVVLGDYEFGRNLVLQDSSRSQKTQRGDATLRFLLFERCEKHSRDEVDAWLAARDGGAAEPSMAGVGGMRESVDKAGFEQAIAGVHEALRAGDSYQVNYTYRLDFDVFGTPLALYRRLRARQPVRYGALIALPDDRWVLSCSPELFVEKEGRTLHARPMKGTAPRSPDPLTDRQLAEFLANDPKNRAENVMIVDLLRNDLSRVAETGSVNVPALFTVEPYASVWQMTSTVEARLRAYTSFADIIRALFPCGSITGAPKHRTMQLIDALESTPRGLYTGAIGWLDAPSLLPAPAQDTEDVCGDFCLSVAIRTLTLCASGLDGARQGKLGIGAGIVLDSVAADEYAECRLKARFLSEADPGFQLFETMYATRENGVRHLERHLARIGASARYLGFAFDEAATREQIVAQCSQLTAETPHRMRLAVDKRGATQLTAALLAPLRGGMVGVLFASDHGYSAMQAGDALLRHKTTRRAEYDRAWHEAESMGAFDMLFFNDRGELTEGGRTTVFVKCDGRWWTPPLSSGVLPGVMRSVLLEDTDLQAAERVLVRADVERAEALVLCNALRGALAAQLAG